MQQPAASAQAALSSKDEQQVKKAACWIAKYNIHKDKGDKDKGDKVVHAPDACLVDPENRDGQFTSPDDSLDRGEQVADIGFVLDHCRTIIVQMPLDPKRFQAIIDLNEEKAALDPRLPRVKRELVIGTLIAGNNVNVFMRSIAQGRPCRPNAKFAKTGEDGKTYLCIEMLRSKDALFAHHCVVGVPMIELSRVMRDEEPTAIPCIQAAENCVGSVRLLERTMQVVKRACAIYDVGSSITTIKEKLAKQFPHLGNDIEGCLHFALRSGGECSPHLQRFSRLAERFVPSGQYLKGNILGKLGDLPAQLPHCRGALAFACLLCPSDCVEHGVCSWVTVNDLNKQCSKEHRAKMLEAESFLCHMYAGRPDSCASLSSAMWEVISAKTALRVARFLLGKKHATVPSFPSLDAIRKKHEEECELVLGGGACLEPKDDVEDKDPQTLSSNFRPLVYGDVGECTDFAAWLQENNIDVGSVLKLHEGTTVGVIKAMDHDAIILRIMVPSEGQLRDQELQVKYADLFATWVQVYDRKEIEEKTYTPWQEYAPESNDSYQVMLAKAKVTQAA